MGTRLRGQDTLGDALSSPLTGFACEDRGTGRCRLQGEGPGGQVGTRAHLQAEGNGSFLV